MSEPRYCEHKDRADANITYWHRTSHSGVVMHRCWDCHTAFLRSIGHDRDLVVGFHVYRTTNPEAPKEQWERVTETPVPIEVQYHAKYPPAGVVYYLFAVPVNAYGDMGAPEPMWDARNTELDDIDDRLM